MTLTKRMAEDLSIYLTEIGIKTAYLHMTSRQLSEAIY